MKLKDEQRLKALLARLNAEKEQAVGAVKSYEEFVELFQNLAKYIKKVEVLKTLDELLRKLFTNFFIEGKKLLK